MLKLVECKIKGEIPLPEVLKLPAKVIDLKHDVAYYYERRGKVLGRGCTKTAYTVKGHPDIVVLSWGGEGRWIKDELEAEQKQLRKLLDVGIPAAQYLKISEDGGIMQRYAVATKGWNGNTIDDICLYANERSIHDCRLIYSKMREERIVVDDPQFLISEQGEVVVADPLRVGKGNVDGFVRERLLDVLYMAYFAIHKRLGVFEDKLEPDYKNFAIKAGVSL